MQHRTKYFASQLERAERSSLGMPSDGAEVASDQPRTEAEMQGHNNDVALDDLEERVETEMQDWSCGEGVRVQGYPEIRFGLVEVRMQKQASCVL